jgi:hypothetical protein
MTSDPVGSSMGRLVDTNVKPLDSTIATRIAVGFRVPHDALHERLPRPWEPDPPEGAAPEVPNLNVIFSDSLLNLDTLGSPAPDESTRSLIFLAKARNTDSGDQSGFVFRIFTNHPEAVPGKYGNSQQAGLRREQRSESVGLETRISELVDLTSPDGGRVGLRLRYLRGAPERVRQRTIVRSTTDESVVRVYESDELTDVLLDAAGGVDRIQYYEFRSTVAEMADVFDGSEKVVAIKVSPWYVRDVYKGV